MKRKARGQASGKASNGESSREEEQLEAKQQIPKQPWRSRQKLKRKLPLSGKRPARLKTTTPQQQLTQAIDGEPTLQQLPINQDPPLQQLPIEEDPPLQQLPIEEDPPLQQLPIEEDPPLQQLPIDQDPPLQQLPIDQDPPLQQLPINQDPPLQQLPIDQDPPLQQLPIDEDPPLQQLPIDQDPPLQQLPIDQDPPLQQLPIDEDLPLQQLPIDEDPPLQQLPIDQDPPLQHQQVQVNNAREQSQRSRNCQNPRLQRQQGQVNNAREQSQRSRICQNPRLQRQQGQVNNVNEQLQQLRICENPQLQYQHAQVNNVSEQLRQLRIGQDPSMQHQQGQVNNPCLPLQRFPNVQNSPLLHQQWQVYNPYPTRQRFWIDQHRPWGNPSVQQWQVNNPNIVQQLPPMQYYPQIAQFHQPGFGMQVPCNGPRAQAVVPYAGPLYNTFARIPPPPKRTYQKNFQGWWITDYIKDKLSISEEHASDILDLFVHHNYSIPVIARYKRGVTHGMNESELREFRRIYREAKWMKKLASMIVIDMKKSGMWTPELETRAYGSKSFLELKYMNALLTRPWSTFLTTDTGKRLRIDAIRCLENRTPPIAELVNKSLSGQRTPEEVITSLTTVVAQLIIQDQRTFNIIEELLSKRSFPFDLTTRLNGVEERSRQFFSMNSNNCTFKPERLRGFGRGLVVKHITVATAEFRSEFEKECAELYGSSGIAPSVKSWIINGAIKLAFRKTINEFIKNEVWKEIVIWMRTACDNQMELKLKKMLLAPPTRGKKIIGISPGLKNAFAFAVISEQGDKLEAGVIGPYFSENANHRNNAEFVLIDLIRRYKCTVIALGDGEGFGDTAIFLAELLDMNREILPDGVFYTIVDETTATVWSDRSAASEEFPVEYAYNRNIIRAVSNARRLRDPMDEIVKVNVKHLTPHRDMVHQIFCRQVIVELVSYVGADLNTASVDVLKNIAGLNTELAENIVAWRKSKGPFINRDDLFKVEDFDEDNFKQCSGFLRIVPETAMAIAGKEIPLSSFEFLDQTLIHPKLYRSARAFLEYAKCDIRDVGTPEFIFGVNVCAQAGFLKSAQTFFSNPRTMESIVEVLRIPKGQDIRDSDLTYRRKKFQDLRVGEVLFGLAHQANGIATYVDVGAEIDGLMVKGTHGLSIETGTRVEVTVTEIDREAELLKVSLIRCF